MSRWFKSYMARMGLDPGDPQQVAQAKVQVVFEQKKGGAGTVTDAFERTLASIRERDPGLLECWRVSLKRWTGSSAILVEEKSAVDRLADIAEPE